MKQVTGKINCPTIQNQVSIQLKLGGHSFSEETLRAANLDEMNNVEFIVLSHKTLLVPVSEFDESVAGKYLQLAGMACTPEQQPVWSEPQDEIIAVMAIDATDLTLIREVIGCKASFTSPLIRKQTFLHPAVWLCQIDTLLYIKVYDTSLRFAEVVPAQTEADIVYYIERFAKQFSTSAFTLYTSGVQSKVVMQVLHRLFSKVLCE